MDRLVAAGAPGTPLLAADAACAHLRPLRPFCAGKQSQAAVKSHGAGAAGTQCLLQGRPLLLAQPMRKPCIRGEHRTVMWTMPSCAAVQASCARTCRPSATAGSSSCCMAVSLQMPGHPLVSRCTGFRSRYGWLWRRCG